MGKVNVRLATKRLSISDSIVKNRFRSLNRAWCNTMIDDTDKRKIYGEMVRKALAEGSLEKVQAEMLISLSELMDVPYEMHCEVVKEVMKEQEEGGKYDQEIETKDARTGDDDESIMYELLVESDVGAEPLEDWNEDTDENVGDIALKTNKKEKEIPGFGRDFLSPSSPSYGIDKKRNFRIAVVGVGGAGGNIVGKMYRSLEGKKITGREMKIIAVDSNLQELFQVGVPHKVYIGEDITGGNGTEGDVILGREAAEFSLERFKASLKGFDVVIVTFGMGGGTGTGAGPVIVRAAKEIGAKVCPIVTLPFKDEGGGKKSNTAKGLKELKLCSDKVLTVPNDLLTSLEPDLPLIKGFEVMDELLNLAILRIRDLLDDHGDMTMNFFRGGGVLNVSMGQGESVEECWDAITGELDRGSGRPSVREALLFTRTRNVIDNREFTVFKRRVEMDLVAVEKVINIKKRSPDNAVSVEIMALFGFHPMEW